MKAAQFGKAPQIRIKGFDSEGFFVFLQCTISKWAESSKWVMLTLRTANKLNDATFISNKGPDLKKPPTPKKRLQISVVPLSMVNNRHFNCVKKLWSKHEWRTKLQTRENLRAPVTTLCEWHAGVVAVAVLFGSPSCCRRPQGNLPFFFFICKNVIPHFAALQISSPARSS